MFSKMSKKDLTIYLTGRALSGAVQQLSATNDITVAQRIGENSVTAAQCAVLSLEQRGYFGEAPAQVPQQAVRPSMPMVAGFLPPGVQPSFVQPPPMVAQSQPVQQPRSNPNGQETKESSSAPQVQHGSPQDLGETLGQAQ